MATKKTKKDGPPLPRRSVGLDRLDASQLLVPSIQRSEFDLDLELTMIDNDMFLNKMQKNLVKEIYKEFNPEEDPTDMSILYEVTKFQTANAKEDFLYQYMDFEELG